ncbi:hypothetical protein EJ110_NYTH05581 [Nymphaea thermarum]|nr:hypothetical protein EJ110_NYTH05581 [Nymphaea thermarum]
MESSSSSMKERASIMGREERALVLLIVSPRHCILYITTPQCELKAPLVSRALYSLPYKSPERALGHLTGRPQPPERPEVAADVHPVLHLYLFYKMADHPVVEVFPTKRHPLCHREIKDENNLLASAAVASVKAVGGGSSTGLVGKAQDVQAGNDAEVFLCLALGVVEVGSQGIYPQSDASSKRIIDEISSPEKYSSSRPL